MPRHIRDPDDPRTREGKDRKRADQAMMRTAAEMARWDAQLTMVAGVQMTNAEAQAARRRVLENGDYYTKLARDRGLIRPGQESELLRTVGQIHDLSEREREGSLTAEEAAKLEELRSSQMGRAAQEVTAQAYKDYGIGMARQSFPGAPQTRPAFAGAVAGDTPAPASQAPVAKPSPVASGFDPSA
jgi:hypothetical protein